MVVNERELMERDFAGAIAEHGGRVFRVGGCVRDHFMGHKPKDIDFCVVGMVKKNFKMLFPEVEEYGKAFPVFRLVIDGEKCEVAFARTERKVGSGYKGFKISSNPKVTIEEDLYRRDLTINAIAMDCLTGEIVDPFHGIQDIKNRILRAVSPHFSEDPIRSLRLASLAARLKFIIEPSTLELAATVSAELRQEPVERILGELTKVLAVAAEPADFFRVLSETDLLEVTFPELFALSEETFLMTMRNMNAVAQLTHNPKVRFAVLGMTLGQEQLRHWNQHMTLPSSWLDAAISVQQINELLSVINPENLVTAIYRLSRGSFNIEEWDIIAAAVGLKLPKLAALKSAMNLVADHGIESLTGKERGMWLRQQHINAILPLIKP